MTLGQELEVCENDVKSTADTPVKQGCIRWTREEILAFKPEVTVLPASVDKDNPFLTPLLDVGRSSTLSSASKHGNAVSNGTTNGHKTNPRIRVDGPGGLRALLQGGRTRPGTQLSEFVPWEPGAVVKSSLLDDPGHVHLSPSRASEDLALGARPKGIGGENRSNSMDVGSGGWRQSHGGGATPVKDTWARRAERTPDRPTERKESALDWRKDKLVREERSALENTEPRESHHNDGGNDSSIDWAMPGDDQFSSGPPPTTLDEFEAIRKKMREAWANDPARQVEAAEEDVEEDVIGQMELEAKEEETRLNEEHDVQQDAVQLPVTQAGKPVDLSSLFSAMAPPSQTAAPPSITSLETPNPPGSPAFSQAMPQQPSLQPPSAAQSVHSAHSAHSSIQPTSAAPLAAPALSKTGIGVGISLQQLFSGAPRDDIDNLRKIWDLEPQEVQGGFSGTSNGTRLPSNPPLGVADSSAAAPDTHERPTIQTADTLKALDDLARAFRYGKFVGSNSSAPNQHQGHDVGMQLDPATMLPPAHELNHHVAPPNPNGAPSRKSAMDILRAMLTANQRQDDNLAAAGSPLHSNLASRNLSQAQQNQQLANLLQGAVAHRPSVSHAQVVPPASLPYGSQPYGTQQYSTQATRSGIPGLVNGAGQNLRPGYSAAPTSGLTMQNLTLLQQRQQQQQQQQQQQHYQQQPVMNGARMPLGPPAAASSAAPNNIRAFLAQQMKVQQQLKAQQQQQQQQGHILGSQAMPGMGVNHLASNNNPSNQLSPSMMQLHAALQQQRNAAPAQQQYGSYHTSQTASNLYPSTQRQPQTAQYLMDVQHHAARQQQRLRQGMRPNVQPPQAQQLLPQTQQHHLPPHLMGHTSNQALRFNNQSNAQAELMRLISENAFGGHRTGGYN